MQLVAVRDIDKSLFQEASCTVGYHAVTFHFSESETTVTTSAFCWLPRQNLGWTAAARVHLIFNHVLESLVVSRTQEYHDFHLSASEAIVHDLVAASLVAKTVQLG